MSDHNIPSLGEDICCSIVLEIEFFACDPSSGQKNLPNAPAVHYELKAFSNFSKINEISMFEKFDCLSASKQLKELKKDYVAVTQGLVAVSQGQHALLMLFSGFNFLSFLKLDLKHAPFGRKFVILIFCQLVKTGTE